MNLYLIYMCAIPIVSSASRINILKAFPRENLRGVEIKTFHIPGSVIISATQQERAKRTTQPPKATIVVPIHVAYDDVDNSDDDEDNEVVDELTPNPGEETVPEDVVSEEEVVPDVGNQTTIPQNVTGETVRFPCRCEDGQCGCCTGILLEQRLKMKACGNISFVPEEFVFDMKFSVNNNTVVRRRVSASDPPPVCFNPRRAPFVEVCAELSNIHIVDRNAHACLDIDANVGGFSVYSQSYNCFSLGSQGVQTNLKPQKIKKPSGAPTSSNLFGNNDDDSDDDDDDDDDDGFFGGDGDDGEGGGIFGGGDGDGGGLFGGGGDDDGLDFGDALDGAAGILDY